ncbi:MAG TPA: FAD-linked oxidase C-terminal domain-containing protein [Gemmatimonadaceae bacterium]|nr:FAD-linked oxidase C-terminal domain-containing protein [Gemmatimonadaceae bacterium]
MDSLIASLERIVGAAHVTTRASELLVYENDGLPGYHKRPRLVVAPGDRDEAIAVVRALAAAKAPFVARGAGTGLSGGSLADGIVMVGMQRMRRIIAVDPVARTATVEPGVVNATLTKAAAPFGLHYAPDPSSQTACTIGGNVAENSGGPHCLKYGVTMNHVVAATVALPDGEVVRLEAPRDDGVGYDLLGAFIGSEGCFGLVVDVTVRLTPNPAGICTMLADFMTVDGAAETVSAIIAAGIVPAALELVDQGTIAVVEASIYAAGYPTDAAACLLVEVDGPEAGLADDVAAVQRICRECGARDVRTATDPADRARLWQGRKKSFGAMGRIAPHLVVQDAVVPRTKLAPILRAMLEIAARHRVRICNVFHAGDGNLHPNIPYSDDDPDEVHRVHAACREIMELCIAEGGTITGEHGVGLDKLPYMESLFAPGALEAMCRLRDAFDPARRANPGKVVPVRHCREWTAAPGARA